MGHITTAVGSRIRMYRKVKKMTIQELADSICKSRATVSKYETGEITIDIDTLYDISKALNVSVLDFLDLPDEGSKQKEIKAYHQGEMRKSPFYLARRLFFYFYDGRIGRMKDGIIDVREQKNKPGTYEATLTICTITSTGRSNATYYKGEVLYSDMLIRFSFFNQCNILEEDLLYIFNPLDVRGTTEGLVCGISNMDFRPCAFKCVVSLMPLEPSEELRHQLLLTREDMDLCLRRNMLLVGHVD